jgi:hypothetical protein
MSVHVRLAAMRRSASQHLSYQRLQVLNLRARVQQTPEQLEAEGKRFPITACSNFATGKFSISGSKIDFYRF